MKNNFLIVGAGFSGAVLGRKLAEAGFPVTVIDKRQHVAGNCHTKRDSATGIMEHKNGPHIFNTDNDVVWNYVNNFAKFMPFINRVKASTSKGVFSLPINLHTINQFYRKNLSPEEAKRFIESIGDQSLTKPASFEEQALRFIGPELYREFFYGYTKKQWGVEPSALPASILKRLPVRFNYDDNYYNKKYQGIPVDGYTNLVEKILDHKLLEIVLGVNFGDIDESQFRHIFYTGPIDEFFNFSHGRLGYRTVFWERVDGKGDMLGNAVINFPDESVPWTRKHEHKHLAPWESHEKSFVMTEFSKETEPDDIPYYPRRLKSDQELLGLYCALAESRPDVSFLGRLATYRYMDMEKVIGEALFFGTRVLDCISDDAPIPTFPEGIDG